MMRVATLLAMLLAVPSAWAEGIPMEPGLWEVTTTMQMPMLPQPRVTTVTECMEKSELSMDEFAGEGMDPNCTFDQNLVDGNTMKWSVDCPVEGGTSHGEWEARSGGDSVTGEGLITMSIQGQEMEMNMSWTGKRIGPCK